LALVELKLERPVPAYQDLQRAVELMPDDVQAAFRLGQLALSIYNADPKHPEQLFDQAAKNATKLLSKLPDGYEGNLLQGALDLVNKKPEDALAHFRGALKAKPDDSTAKLGLASALVDDRQADAGLEAAREVIQHDRTFGAAYDFLFQRYALAGRAVEAENILKEKVSNNPKDAAFILELARYYVSQQKPAEVASTLQRMTGNPKDFPNGSLAAGDFYASFGKPDQALPQYQEGLRRASGNKNIYRKRIAGIMAAQRNWPEVYTQLQACLKDQPEDQEAKLMRATAWLEEGKRENMDPAIAELRAQLAKHPQEVRLRFQIGNALAQKGDLEGARRDWAAAAQQKRDYLPPRFALAELDLAQGKAQDALRESEEITAVAPRDERARLLEATCQIAAGQLAQARAELNRLAADFPKSPQVRFRLGILALAEKKFGEAEQVFRELAKAAGPDPQVYSGLAQAFVGQKETAKAIEAVQDELKRSPGSLGLRQVLAQVAMSSGKYDIAIEQYKQLVTAAPKSVDFQRALAAAYSAQGNAADAVGVLQAAVQKDPSQVAVSLDLTHALLSAGRVDDAKTEYRRLLKIQPNNPNALNDLAYLMADSGENLDQALELARKGTQFATEPSLKTSLSDTIGWIYLKKHMYDSALQTFQSLVNGNPESMTYRYHLGTTLFEMGNKPKAKAELEAALGATGKSVDEPKIRELLARL
jgi:predicted Zn-dependent protease